MRRICRGGGGSGGRFACTWWFSADGGNDEGRVAQVITIIGRNAGLQESSSASIRWIGLLCPCSCGKPYTPKMKV